MERGIRNNTEYTRSRVHLQVRQRSHSTFDRDLNWIFICPCFPTGSSLMKVNKIFRQTIVIRFVSFKCLLFKSNTKRKKRYLMNEILFNVIRLVLSFFSQSE